MSAPEPGGLPPGISPIPHEARPYQGLRAGVVSRVAANLIDAAVVIATLLALYAGYAGLRFLWSPTSFTFPAPHFALVLVLAGALQISYFTVAWASGGRTYGDHVLGLRVVNIHGRRLSVAESALRAVLCVFVPIGLLWVIVSSSNRSIQDTLLRTSVIYDWDVRPRRSRVDRPPGRAALWRPPPDGQHWGGQLRGGQHRQDSERLR